PLWEHFRFADPAAEAALRACLTAHAPLAELDAGFATGKNEVAVCRLRGSALTDAQGRFAGYVGTARVLATDAAAPPSPALADSAFPESALDNERESFSYTVSHDLRAPIRVVEGFTKILKEDYGRLLDRIGNDHLDRVLGAAARMNSMIDALLALSKLSTQPLACQPVNLSQLAGYIADDLRRQSPERRVAVHIEPGLQVQGDPTLLRVVLENLLGNAWKYTAKSRDAQIWFGPHPQQPSGAFTVRDNGAGFDMRFADRLFGVFQRLHSATEFQGTGVGLASVRRIVRRHGGEVWAESEVDRGASFHFSLGTALRAKPSSHF
ncbi:MAG TPA: ATP-binding protein, partial [Albitalea sp.]|nr:ATP-binding protein [Albitalea sp.]